jgi:adenine/guanine phosphoribosyltransferase-like PRPP-binding protein
VEARGFLFAAPLLCCSDHVDTIVPIRKKGKLPHDEGDLHKVCIEKEYGSDEVFYRRSDLAACTVTGDTIELTLLDDLLATGGTAEGIAKALNGEVIDGKRVVIKEFVFVVELPALGGRKILESIAPVHSLMSLAGVE